MRIKVYLVKYSVVKNIEATFSGTMEIQGHLSINADAHVVVHEHTLLRTSEAQTSRVWFYGNGPSEEN